MHLSKTILRFGWFLSAVILLAGCATPIGIKEVSPHDSYRELMANPLTEGVASNATKIVLRRFNLVGEYENDPGAVIAYLHDKALHDDRRDTLYALAELSYLYGERLEKSIKAAEQALAPDYFLIASIYAYFFLLDDRPEPAPNAFDIRARTACDLYNFALWRGMQTGNAGALNLTAAVRKLPVGALAITVDLTKYPWKLEEFESIPNGLYLTQPYRPDRIPVIFVHGTFSNPAWWAEMLNILRGDPILQQKFQFWAFLYNSSAPIVVSATDLRDALRNKVAQLDPEGKDPALREMVVVGHSQGGAPDQTDCR